MAAAFQQHCGGEGAGVQQPGQLGAAFQMLDAVAVDRRQEHHAGSQPGFQRRSVGFGAQLVADDGLEFMQRSAMQMASALGCWV